MSSLLFFGLAEVIVVKNAGQDTFANSVDIVLGFLGSDVQRNLESILDGSSLSEEQVQV